METFLGPKLIAAVGSFSLSLSSLNNQEEELSDDQVRHFSSPERYFEAKSK